VLGYCSVFTSPDCFNDITSLIYLTQVGLIQDTIVEIALRNNPAKKIKYIVLLALASRLLFLLDLYCTCALSLRPSSKLTRPPDKPSFSPLFLAALLRPLLWSSATASSTLWQQYSLGAIILDCYASRSSRHREMALISSERRRINCHSKLCTCF
jgi:hypothetical protein